MVPLSLFCCLVQLVYIGVHIMARCMERRIVREEERQEAWDAEWGSYTAPSRPCKTLAEIAAQQAKRLRKEELRKAQPERRHRWRV